MITDYLIVTSETERGLQELVLENIKDWGWQPIGGVHSVYWVSEPSDELQWDWTQAMVKYE